MMAPRVRAPLAAISCLLIVACAGRPVELELPGPPPVLGPRELAAWSKPPAPASDVPRRLPLAIERIALDNGMHVTVVARPGTPSTAIGLRVPSMRDSGDGPVAVMAEALRAGTRQRDGAMLINPKLGAPIQIRTSNAGTTFSWEVLPRASSAALQLLGAFVRSPAFNPPDVMVRLHQELAHIQRYSGSESRVRDLVHAAFPGFKRPTPEADAQGLIKLTPEVLRTVHECTLRPEGMELVVVGPVAAESVEAWAKAAFSGWHAARPSTDPACAAWLVPPAPAHPELARLSRVELQIVYGLFDPVIIVSVAGPEPASDDYLPFTLLTQVLARRRASAFRALRDMGATYDIAAESIDDYAHMSLFDLSGQIDPEASQEALRTLVTDIHTIADNLDTLELSLFARRWRNVLITSFGSNVAVARRIFWQLDRGREPATLPDLLSEIEHVDVMRCRDVARRWLSSAQPSIGMTGLPGRFVHGLGIDVHVSKFYWSDVAAFDGRF